MPTGANRRERRVYYIASGSSSGLTRMRRFPSHFDFWTPARVGADRTGWTASQSGPLEGLAKHSFWPSLTSTIHRLRLCPQHYSKRPEHHPSPYPEYHGSIRIGTIVPRTIIPV